MRPSGPLMIEHRLIERMIALIKRELPKIRRSQEVDPLFIDTAVDFIRVYADRTHHGKEEDILFRVLKAKPMRAPDLRIMEELVQEHVLGRKQTAALAAANTLYRKGDTSALDQISDHLLTLTDFYLKHILKEDKVFFPAAMECLSYEEQQAMLAEFREFDQKMIHERYRSVVESIEKRE